MIPSVIQLPGGQLHYVRGFKTDLLNLTFVSTASAGTSIGAIEANKTSPTLGYNEFFHGGINTYWPASYANHKPMAFYKNRIYMALNNVKESLGNLYIGRWDGSGIFKHEGSNYSTSPGRCGRGFELISPSGTTSAKSNDLGLLVHNGNLFLIGAHWGNEESPASNNWLNKFKWYWDHSSFGGSPSRLQRRYRVGIIQKNDKRIMGPATLVSATNATNGEHTHCCDIIGFNNDIYYANWIDLLKIHGGSGQIQLIEGNVSKPSSKCFSIWPSGGYNTNTSDPIGEKRLLILSGSGVLKRIHASGTNTLVGFSSIRNDVRSGENFSTRILSSTLEPGRSCLLTSYNNRLHSFITTATSGYLHFSCAGNPSGTSNWTDLTNNLPQDLRALDGNIFGFKDDYRNKLYIAHITMSKVGAYGYQGLQTSAGATYIWQLDENGNWSSVHQSMPGLPGRGLIPYQNLGPAAFIPSGSNPTIFKCSDYAIINYALYDFYKRSVDVDIEYSSDNGLSWHEARQFRSYSNGQPVGSGKENLKSSPNGTNYDFYWHYVNDIGFSKIKESFIRIRPRLKR